MNSINPTKIENVVNTARTVAKDCPQHAKTIEKKISQLSETATSQSAKITKLNDAPTKATKSLNSAVASDAYKATRNEPFCKIIEQDGQKILVTSSMENPENAIVTFFNGGAPGKSFECTFEELGPRCGIHI